MKEIVFEPVKGQGFEPNGGGFSYIHVGKKIYTAEQIRKAVSLLEANIESTEQIK